jgi:hypothetical protein
MRRQIDHTTLQMALVGYESQLATVTARMAEIRKQIGGKSAANGGGGDIPTPFRKGSMSAAARKRIAAAQRARWAAYRAGHKAPATKRGTPKRTLSRAARAKLVVNLAKARAAKAAKARAAAA